MIVAACERSELAASKAHADGSSASLGGAVLRPRPDDLTEGLVHRRRGWKLGGDIGREKHKIRSFREAARVLAAHSASELVLGPHVFLHATTFRRLTRLLHRSPVPDGWRVER